MKRCKFLPASAERDFSPSRATECKVKRKLFLIAIALAVLAIAFIAANRDAMPVSAKPGDAYTIDWYTIGNGGGSNSGGTYVLTGTIGQPEANTLNGGPYTLAGGFWGGEAKIIQLFKLLLPAILK